MKKFTFIVLLLISFTASAQEKQVVLFQDEQPFDLTILTDWKKVLDGKREQDPMERPYTKASLLHTFGGKTHNLVVDVRVRGWSRLADCKMPLLKVKRIDADDPGVVWLPAYESKETLFAKAKALRLVTRCDRTERGRWVYLEQTMYKMFNVISDLSFATRGVNLTLKKRSAGDFNDLDGDVFDSFYGFFIESEKNFAKRKGLTYVEEHKFPIERVSVYPLNVMIMFELMVGNHDMEISRKDLRNALIFQNPAGEYLPVPYDFDWSQLIREGIVTYDGANYLSLCGQTDSSFENLRSFYLGKQAALEKVVNDSQHLNSAEKGLFLQTIRQFMTNLKDPTFVRFLMKDGKKSCK